MGHQAAGRVAQGRDELHDVLSEVVEGVVSAGGRLAGVAITSAWRFLGKTCTWNFPAPRNMYITQIILVLLVCAPHVNGHHMIVSVECLQLIAPGEPELQVRRGYSHKGESHGDQTD